MALFSVCTGFWFVSCEWHKKSFNFQSSIQVVQSACVPQFDCGHNFDIVLHAIDLENNSYSGRICFNRFVASGKLKCSFTLMCVFDCISALLFFYVPNTFGFVCFFGMALKWPDLMRYWHSVEVVSPTFHNQQQKKKFICKIRIVVFMVFSLALGRY